MKKNYFISLVLLCSLFNITSVNAQLLVSNALTPSQLVQYNFIWGGLLLNNVTTSSAPDCIGAFMNGNTTNIGMPNGVLMTTGGISNVPNHSSYFLSHSLNGAGDSLLGAMSGGITSYDATILEFDFIPLSTPVIFTYVFGSEEYPEYVCSNFNDAFGFFVSGSDPGGGNYINHNVAIIPGSTLPVTINTVNPGVTGAYGSSGNCTSLAYSSKYIANTGSTICFDGFTIPLTATINVVPFTTYHIKLAVSDIGDGAYDSGVFLQANSFFTNAVKLDVVSSSQHSAKSVEGCASGMFKFSIHDPAIQNDTVRFTIEGSALNGVDYDLIPSYVVIPAGSDSVSLTINPIIDALSEGIEDVILHVQVSPYGTQDISLNIFDDYIFQGSACVDQTICNGQAATLSASGGSFYYWNTGETTSLIQVNPNVNSNYSVEIYDSLGCSMIDSVFVTVNNNPTAGFNFSNNGQEGISFNDQSLNGTSWYWDFGNGNYSIEQNPVFSYLSQGNYTVMQVVQNSCGSDTSYQTISILLNVTNNYTASKIELFPNPNDGNFYINYKSENNNDLLIQIINTNGKTVYSQNIGNNNLSGNNPINIKNLSKGLYQLKISCGNDYDVVRFMVK